MTWRTHMVGGIASLWMVMPLLPFLAGNSETSRIGSLAVGAAFGALLPDLDAAQSKIK